MDALHMKCRFRARLTKTSRLISQRAAKGFGDGMKGTFAVVMIAFAAALLLFGCAGAPAPKACTMEAKICPDGSAVGRVAPNCDFAPCPTPAPANNSTAGGNGSQLANPASVYCESLGYALEIRDAAAGQEGYCIFPNGRECDEWALFRGECTDADSFSMVETAGFVANPQRIEYRFYNDGNLTLTTTGLDTGNTSALEAHLAPSAFAGFISALNVSWFQSLDGSYRTCGNTGCPSDMPSTTFVLAKQGAEKSVYVYSAADRPSKLDDAEALFKSIVQNATFVDVNASAALQWSKESGVCSQGSDCQYYWYAGGCYTPEQMKVIQEENARLGVHPSEASPIPGATCSCVKNACKMNVPPVNMTPPADNMTKNICLSARGSWNECASACRGAPEGTACTLQCVQECECGGIAGFGCPTGYSCGDYLPAGAADAMGVCKPVSCQGYDKMVAGEKKIVDGYSMIFEDVVSYSGSNGNVARFDMKSSLGDAYFVDDIAQYGNYTYTTQDGSVISVDVCSLGAETSPRSAMVKMNVVLGEVAQQCPGYEWFPMGAGMGVPMSGAWLGLQSIAPGNGSVNVSFYSFAGENVTVSMHPGDSYAYDIGNGDSLRLDVCRIESAGIWLNATSSRGDLCRDYPILMMGENLTDNGYAVRFNGFPYNTVNSEGRMPALITILKDGASLENATIDPAEPYVFTAGNGDKIQVDLCATSHQSTLSSFIALMKINATQTN